MTEYLDLADYLLIAEAVVGVPAEVIASWPRMAGAESALHAPAASFEGVEFYPDVIDKAAVLCIRLARNHPLPDGNKRVAYLALVEPQQRLYFEPEPHGQGSFRRWRMCRHATTRVGYAPDGSFGPSAYGPTGVVMSLASSVGVSARL